MKKLSIVLATLFLINCSTVAFAVDSNNVEPIQPTFTGLHSISVYISLSPTGILTCTSSAYVKTGYSGEATWILQQNNGSGWSDISTWTNSGNGPIVLILDKTRYAYSGYSYRLKATVKIYNSNGICVDNVIRYSGTVYYP